MLDPIFSIKLINKMCFWRYFWTDIGESLWSLTKLRCVFWMFSCVFHVFFMCFSWHIVVVFLNCSISLNALCFCWMVHSSAVPYSYQYTNYRYNNYQYNNYERNRLWSWFTGVYKITFSNTTFFGFQVDRNGCGVFFLFF